MSRRYYSEEERRELLIRFCLDQVGICQDSRSIRSFGPAQVQTLGEIREIL